MAVDVESIDELVEKLVEAINGIEDEWERCAALLHALGKLLGDVDLSLVALAGVVRLLEAALDEVVLYHCRSAETSTLIL